MPENVSLQSLVDVHISYWGACVCGWSGTCCGALPGLLRGPYVQSAVTDHMVLPTSPPNNQLNTEHTLFSALSHSTVLSLATFPFLFLSFIG